MVFSGSLNKASTVTVGGNLASLDSTQTNFRGNASVTQGTNNVPIVATNLNGYATTNTFQVVIPPASGSYSYDLNGNLLNDGTRTYSWDAKDELVGIVYTSGPNSGNHTEFTYNGAGARVKIVERTGTVLGSGTITSTKQYVGEEERDGNNLITKRYFAQGEQRISGSTATNYFYTFDHLGSVREMMDNNGTTIDARYSYDPYGRRTQVSGSIVCDFGFTGYYTHANSGLDLSATRAYDPNTGRFNQRDPSGESSGLNLYAYCGGNPVNYTDPTGQAPTPPWLVIVYVVLKPVLDFLFPGADESKTKPPEPPRLHSPGKPVAVDPEKDTPGDKGPCDKPPKPPLPSPVPGPVPVPVPALTPAERAALQDAIEDAAAQARAYAAWARALTVAGEVDEVVLTAAVIIK